jgi:HlyD family secretion protein
VKPGQVLVRLDTTTLEAQLTEANARVAATEEELAVARAAITSRKAEIQLATIEQVRTRNLVAVRAASQRELDVRNMKVETTNAGLASDVARLAAAEKEVAVAQANVATIQTRINDATLVSPALGRVLYRLAEPGEVLGPGGKALTLVNLEDVYMEIFLPSREAAALKNGADARITFDFEPGRAAQGYVSFVSPEAQFTPKEVETKSEREKLMFRVKIQLPAALVTHYVEGIKTGVRGVGYVKVEDSAEWPDSLNNLVSVNEPAPKPGAAPAETQVK